MWLLNLARSYNSLPWHVFLLCSLALSFSLLSVGILSRELWDSLVNGFHTLKATWRHRENSVSIKGATSHAPLLTLFLCAITAGLVALLATADSRAGMLTLHNVYVMQSVGDFGYQMRESSGKPFYANFCPLPEWKAAPFDAGETFAELRVVNRGNCWEAKHFHMLRDAQGGLIRGN